MHWRTCAGGGTRCGHERRADHPGLRYEAGGAGRAADDFRARFRRSSRNRARGVPSAGSTSASVEPHFSPAAFAVYPSIVVRQRRARAGLHAWGAAVTVVASDELASFSALVDGTRVLGPFDGHGRRASPHAPLGCGLRRHRSCSADRGLCRWTGWTSYGLVGFGKRSCSRCTRACPDGRWDARCWRRPSPHGGTVVHARPPRARKRPRPGSLGRSPTVPPRPMPGVRRPTAWA